MPMKKNCSPIVLCVFLSIPAPAPLSAHVGPSVHDAVAGVLERMRRDLPPAEVRDWTAAKAEQFLTAREREILGGEHISFHVNVPVRVWILRDRKLGDEPFWLGPRGFRPTALSLKSADADYDVWRQDFSAGRVGLGVPCLSGAGRHYLVVLAPSNEADNVKVTELYPGQLRLATFRARVKAHLDQNTVFASVPPELDGRTLIRTDNARVKDAQLLNRFGWTAHPSSDRPDHVLLTWSDDPRTTQTIQWRTSTNVPRGYVLFQKQADFHGFQPHQATRTAATTARIETPKLINDPVVHWHTAELRGLSPGTTYVYSVGDGRESGWTAPVEFTTAPAGEQPFSFIYLGDAQNGLDRWGTLVRNAFRSRPDAAFYVMAGDLVDRGAERDDWDSLFHNAAGVYDRRPVVPALGNHECQGGKPELYLRQFALPRNGPANLEPERAYSFHYANALFVILDSNLPPAAQTNWLERQLSQSPATWKFVVYHHPAYSSSPIRDQKELREVWTPLFDKYHVDIALQGHDHAYLRTYPLKAGQRVASPREGTVYLITVSGTKMRPQARRDYTEVGFTDVATYQVLDIQLSGNRLVYRAHDLDGHVRDQFVIEK
jgi:hypothetical protein